jgi:hypothetical protein
MTSDKPP